MNNLLSEEEDKKFKIKAVFIATITIILGILELFALAIFPISYTAMWLTLFAGTLFIGVLLIVLADPSNRGC